ncbi:MAG: lyase family protein [Candidatus Kapabacteria bacterium]|nr:lyase family protein [Candidatus Kapabacteria bacterium]
MRTEKDQIGTYDIPKEALYGIHSIRARHNFPDNTGFSIEWYKAVCTVKLAYYLNYEKFAQAVQSKFKVEDLPLKLIEPEIVSAMIRSADEMSQGKYFEHFIVPAIQGGAGTSVNMNINEIIANSALLSLGHNCGDYHIIDPIEHANIYQSTNDVIPSALRIAVMALLEQLEKSINDTRAIFERLEKEHNFTLRLAYTQMQAAVPTTFGKLFSAYTEALWRDWWRVSKCFERIKVVNIGGSAAGTGLTVPRYFIMEVPNILKNITNLPVTRSENLTDATSNQDTLVEVHAILKSHAVNLEKIVSDLRLLSSDIGEKSINLPTLQAGSSIMPGKVNPVVNEFVIEVSHIIYAHDQLITGLTAMGCLDLNAYLPTIGHYLISSLKLLIAANETMSNNLISKLTINEDESTEKVMMSPTISTALLPHIGYHNATQLANFMVTNSCDIIDANRQLKIIDEHILVDLIKAENLNKLGFSVSELISYKTNGKR